MRKIPFARIELTSQRVRGLRGTSELPGRPVGMGQKIRTVQERVGTGIVGTKGYVVLPTGVSTDVSRDIV